MSAARLVVVEDEAHLAEVISDNLRLEGWDVAVAGDGPAALALIRARPPDLVPLDVMLPGLDGFAVCQTLRAEGNEVPILFLTAKSGQGDRLRGLELGGDDYLGKPFDLRELLARMKSVLRRAEKSRARPASGASRRVPFGNCQLDLDRHQLIGSSGEDIALTAMEFDLLRAFAEHPNRVLSRDQLLTLTRNREWEPFDRSIDIRIARLRRKIEDDPDNPKTIKTIRGSGYIFIPSSG